MPLDSSDYHLAHCRRCRRRTLHHAGRLGYGLLWLLWDLVRGCYCCNCGKWRWP